ncbi:hypothetical protein, conserved [Trypanosoma cruzi]|uniref:Uncharacterized protein n=1 Tax=Trypanosoma cruzi (strain CL Brener) TaxID=353153 RepID=Q4DJN7_TRYCC|nr:hypothetical protein, conserved [Trypanosoma cruzi]EAN92738.1 hypothetical protein, conserved [Trypanosoma cruzi]|eukprot:XP_814589.1 hypothetical protein [Trypanosoma cruzi strain CL Brener]
MRLPEIMLCCDCPSDYVGALAMEIAKLMEERAYRRHMLPCLSLRQRSHLWALRCQALFGDAPSDLDVPAPNEKEKVNETAQKQLTPMESSLAGLPKLPQRPLHWYQFTMRFYYSAWVALRGKMTPQLAAEALCTEFLYLLKVHNSPAMLPLMEAASNTARAKAMAFNLDKREKGSAGGGTINKTAGSSEGFYVRGLHGDPVVIAFLWFCRAQSIPCEVDFEPLSSELPKGEEDLFLVKSLSQNTVVTEPLAAFVLCVDLYLPQCGHWLGELPPCSSSSLHTTRALRKSAWIEYMHHILVDLRAPLLRFMREVTSQMRNCGKSQESQFSQPRSIGQADASCGDSSEVLRRRIREMSDVAMKSLAHYERFAHHYYATIPQVTVSVAELCVAAYSFVICTTSLCKDFFPPLEAVPSALGKIGVHAAVPWGHRVSLYRDGESKDPLSESLQDTTALLSGVPKAYQEIATRILRSATSAHSPSVKVLICENDGRNKITDKGTKKIAFLSSGLLCLESAWDGLTPGANEAAMLVVDRWIWITCSPHRRTLAEVLSYAWCTANEQCIGFPFLVLDKEQRDFVTTLNAHPTSLARHEAPWKEGKAAAVARTFRLKLRTALGASPPSSERRTYRSYAAKL